MVRLSLVVWSLVFTAPAAAAEEPGEVVVTRVALATPTQAAPRGPWVRVRLGELVQRIAPECYAPALVKHPTWAGELTVKATLGRTGRLSGVTVRSARGATLGASLRACVARIFARTPLDMRPLPPIEHDPELPGAYYDPPRDPPARAELPLRVTLGLTFTAPTPVPPPVVAPPPLEPEPKQCQGPSPAGCAHTGCPTGQRCETHLRCIPSTCGCQADTGTWICTTDCGGGLCVPDDLPAPR